jgi:PRTRC genetic system protein B
MNNVSHDFNDRYNPVKALLIYQSESKKDEDNPYQQDKEEQIYVESYDIGKNGNPINAHPLTIREMLQLSELLQSSVELKGGYLKSRGILPGKVLYINPQGEGNAVWYTPPQETNLFFIDKLDIPCGRANLPGLIWKATKDSLTIFAYKGKSKPGENTALYHAPFFNIYANANVCMGTVTIQIDRTTALEEFISKWESYFFNSYFSHSISGHQSCKIDLSALWRELVRTENPFPTELLCKTGQNLKNIIR